jgi:hypothetical protein
VKTSYKEDEKNTAMTTPLLMKIGGHTWQGGTGIHGRHLDAGSRIRYVSTDDQRQVIPVVYYTDDNGKTVEYVSTDTKVSKEQLEKGEHRMMDCIDCHNRPTHAFELPDKRGGQPDVARAGESAASVYSKESSGIAEGGLSRPRHGEKANY